MFFPFLQPSLIVLGPQDDAHAVVILCHPLARINGYDGKGLENLSGVLGQLDQLRDVLDVGLADVVMIDNFDLTSMRKAVALVAGRLVIEASGGITLDTAAAIAETGVDYLSSGALTHSVRNLDVGLDIEM